MGDRNFSLHGVKLQLEDVAMGIIDADTHIDETDPTRKPEEILRAVTWVRP
jgi:hypothetical protein